MKKILAGVLALAFVFGGAALPANIISNDFGISVSAEGEASGQCGDNLTWYYDGTTLTISGTGDMWDYDYISGGKPLFFSDDPNNYISPEKVIVNEGVTSIGENAFLYSSLKEISLPNSLQKIGKGAFQQSSIESIYIPNSVTIIDDWAFCFCANLKSVHLPEGITSINKEVFLKCFELTDINIPNNVTDIESRAFELCKLEQIYFPQSLVNIGYNAFFACPLKGNFTLPSNVKNIGEGAFNWTQLETINIPASVESIGNYALCSSSYINVDANNPFYASIDGVLYNKNIDTLITVPNKISGVTIPESVTTIKTGAFTPAENDYNFTVTIPATVINIEKVAINKTNNLKLYCYVNTAGEQYAVKNDISYELLDADNAKSYSGKGDQNGDSRLTVADLVLTAKKINNNEYDDISDINGDGKITVSDILALAALIKQG